MRPRVLITAAGRRRYLVDWFREAGAVVIATDMSPLAAALAAADVAVTTPASAEPGYPDALAAVCSEHGVDLVLSVNDLDLPVLAAQRARLESLGCRVVVATADVVALAADKSATAEAVAALGLAAVPTWTDPDAALASPDAPAAGGFVVKPRYGSGSSAVMRAHGERQLRLATALLTEQVGDAVVADRSPDGADVLIQPLLRGPEYGLDVVNDLDGRHRTTLVKRKLAMRAGETDKARTEHVPELEAIGRRLGRGPAPPGRPRRRRDAGRGRAPRAGAEPSFRRGLPVQPRRGGGRPRAMLAWWRGDDPDPAWLSVRPGIVAAKHDVVAVMPPGIGS